MKRFVLRTPFRAYFRRSFFVRFNQKGKFLNLLKRFVFRGYLGECGLRSLWGQGIRRIPRQGRGQFKRNVRTKF